MKRAVEFSEYVFWIETLDEEMKRQLMLTDRPKGESNENND